MGVELLPELAPKMAFHFSIHGGWPTADASPFLDLARSPEPASMLAQRCDNIPIEVHADRDAPEASALILKVPAESLAPTVCLFHHSCRQAKRHSPR
jgi:hypothetical protein